MKCKEIIISIFLYSISLTRLQAQIDPHFSQYYAFPLWLNPALTGEFDGAARLGTNVRDQWQNINKAFRTGSISADFRTPSKLGFGISILDQNSGEVGFNYLTALGSISYEVIISNFRNNKLNFGIQAGILNRSYSRNKLQFDNQYNPLRGFDPGLPSGELSLINSAVALDLNAGLFYYEDNPRLTINKFIGMGIFHLNRGNDPYPIEGIQSIMPIRISVHGGLNIETSELIILTPHFIVVYQQSNKILAFGLNSDFVLSKSKGFIFGGMFRKSDAFSVNCGFYNNNLNIGLSYDFTTSSLVGANLGQGGPELSLSYIVSGKSKGPNRICPRF